MHYLHNVYEIKAHKINGSVVYGEQVLNKSDLICFALLPKAPYLPIITIDLSNNRELIYFKRVFCRSDWGIYHIDYHVGYRKNDYKFEIVVNAATGEVKI